MKAGYVIIHNLSYVTSAARAVFLCLCVFAIMRRLCSGLKESSIKCDFFSFLAPFLDVPAPRRRGRPPLLGKRGQAIELECPICHKTFSNKSNYDGHLTMHTPQRKRYRCDICNKSFLWRNNVYAHKRKIHNVPSSRGNKSAGTKQGPLASVAPSEPHWTTVMHQSMLAPSGFSASPSLLLLQAASAAWSDSREPHEK